MRLTAVRCLVTLVLALMFAGIQVGAQPETLDSGARTTPVDALTGS